MNRPVRRRVRPQWVLKRALAQVREALLLLTKTPRVRFSAIIDTGEKLVHLHNLGTDEAAAAFTMVAVRHMEVQSPEGRDYQSILDVLFPEQPPLRPVRCVVCDETFHTNDSPPVQCTQCGSTVTEMS